MQKTQLPGTTLPLQGEIRPRASESALAARLKTRSWRLQKSKV